MKGRARAAEALHLHLQDERSGSASGPVDEFQRWLLVRWVEPLHLSAPARTRDIQLRLLRPMKFPRDLVPQKAVAEDLCVSLVTLWRARQSGIPDFPTPVIIRNMVFWRKDDVQQLEDALLKFEGRGKFEAERKRATRNERLVSQLPKLKRQRRVRQSDSRQLDFF